MFQFIDNVIKFNKSLIVTCVCDLTTNIIQISTQIYNNIYRDDFNSFVTQQNIYNVKTKLKNKRLNKYIFTLRNDVNRIQIESQKCDSRRVLM